MLDPRPVNTAGTSAGQVFSLNGRKLAKALKAGTINPEFAARLAYGLRTGTVIGNLTAKQAKGLTGATTGNLAAVRRANRPVGPRVLYRSKLSTTGIDAIVTKIGEEKVLASLDRLTAPALVAGRVI